MEKKKYVLNKVVLIALCVLCGLMTILELFLAFEMKVQALNLAEALIFLAIMYYAVFAYKKPHGNELKYIILFTSVFTLLKIFFELVGGNHQNAFVLEVFQYLFLFIAIVLMSYVSGRLDRIKENKIIFLVALGLIVLSVVLAYIKGNPAPSGDLDMSPIEDMPKEIISKNLKDCLLEISRVSIIIQYLSLIAAYLCRYRLHKEAGMKDK